MKRVATVIRLKTDKESEYRAMHAAVPPDVLAALHRAHIANYSIFLRDGLLFSYYEYTGDDLAADLARLAEDEVTRRWWQLTDPCQQPVASAAEGEWWAPMEEVFHDEGPRDHRV
ncbi:L-rhamnose mutarotase [Streptomyces sp. NPDC050997]|uniref:L-rhamnose mutarotase n=1 Tax=Streptomyces sp. NPDC050997 TaxID=3155519 RepID=UPI00343EF774